MPHKHCDQEVLDEGTKKPLYHALGKNSCAGSAGDVLEDNPVGRLKVFVYELPR